MSHKVLFVALLATAAIGATALIADAQGPRPGGSRSPAALTGTGFTYQGQLKNNSALVNGTCDFQFGLWDGAASGPQYGATQTVSALAVTNGLFTTQLDFGIVAPNNVFTGTARYLQSAVRCPSGGGGYTALNPRQALTPAPYAFALPGMYTQQNATSPNVIGGYSGNIITPTLFGVTISGGGASGQPNRAWAHFATVGGGFGNTANGDAATIGGGYVNLAKNSYATVGGGLSNSADGNSATVGGGSGNAAAAHYSTIGGGYSNFINAQYSTIGGGKDNAATGFTSTVSGGGSNIASNKATTVGGGISNAASNDHATVGGGFVNNASGAQATVAGGGGNTASGANATVAGGNTNNASGDFSTVPGGWGSVASHYGEMAYANGRFALSGDAQTSMYVLRRTTGDTTATEIFLDGDSTNQRLTVASDRTLVFDILVVGRRSSMGHSAGYRFVGVIENVIGTTAIVGAVAKTVITEDDANWDVNVTADDTNDSLKITVTGPSGTVRWVAVVRTAEVAN